MIISLFWFTLSLLAFISTLLIISIRSPHLDLWPPNPIRPLSRNLLPLLFFAASTSLILLGILDWNRTGLPLGVRYGAGVPFWLLGMGLAFWAISVLGVERAVGKASGLEIRGPYRFTRNPQYLGFMIGLVGWVLLTSSLFTFIAALVALVPLLLVPCLEEPWLMEKFGVDYADYLHSTPCFLLHSHKNSTSHSSRNDPPHT